MASISKRKQNEALILGFFRYRSEAKQLIPKLRRNEVGQTKLFQNFTGSKWDESSNFTGSKWDKANYSKT